MISETDVYTSVSMMCPPYSQQQLSHNQAKVLKSASGCSFILTYDFFERFKHSIFGVVREKFVIHVQPSDCHPSRSHMQSTSCF